MLLKGARVKFLRLHDFWISAHADAFAKPARFEPKGPASMLETAWTWFGSQLRAAALPFRRLNVV